MPRSLATGQGVLELDRSMEGPSPGYEMDRKGPHRASPRLTPTEREDIDAAPLLDAACSALGSNEEVAELLDLDPSLLSKMRQGKKSTPIRVLWRLMEREEVALAVGALIARRAGLAPPRPVQRVTRAEATEALAVAVRRTTDVWKLYRRAVADELGADEEQIEGAFLETAGGAK